MTDLAANSFVQFRCIPQHLAADTGMVHGQAAFHHQVFHVAQGEAIYMASTSDAKHDNVVLKMTPLEQGRPALPHGLSYQIRWDARLRQIPNSFSGEHHVGLGGVGGVDNGDICFRALSAGTRILPSDGPIKRARR